MRGPADCMADLTNLRERCGGDWTLLPEKLRELIGNTIRNPHSTSDAILILADALAELADELFDPHLETALTEVTTDLRNLAPLRGAP